MDRWARRTFFAALAAALLAFAYTVSSFLLPVFLGAMLVVLARPLGDALLRRMPRRPGLAAFLSTLLVFLLVVLPLASFLAFVTREIVLFVGRAHRFLTVEGGSEKLTEALRSILVWLPDSVAETIPTPDEALEPLLATLGTWAGSRLGGVASAATSIAIHGFLTFVSAYYLFHDGPRLAERMQGVLPLNPRYLRELYTEFRNTILAVFYGTGIVGLVQGALIGIAFWIAGVPEAGVWAALAVVTAFIPMLGSGLVWAPAGLVLLVVGKTWQGIFVLVVGALIVSSVDNLLRPLLVKGRIRVHSLVIFLSIFGGLSAFGAIGIVLGPIIASLTMALLRIWERDFVAPKEAASEKTTPVRGLEALQELTKR